ncbi:MAG: hypothetical protein IJW18_05805 [Lachnospiraceae bacterium]|nr:hypothetical protein [Lachnospiraceae bacterium]
MKKHAKCKLRFLNIFGIALIAVTIYLIAGNNVTRAAAKKATISGCPSTTIYKTPDKNEGYVTTSNGSTIILPSGYEVLILDETTFDGNALYQISFVYNTDETYTGYIYKKYVKPYAATGVMSDAEFEQYLANQGFPESYKTYLRAIHEQHPLWVFEAQHTNLDWAASVAAESVPGKNLIPNTSPTSWKSMESGAYNSATNTWVVFDGSTWVTASKDLIAYYMDPRNFLNDVNIFQFEVLSYDASYQTAEGIETILDRSFMDCSYVDTDGWAATYAEAFIYAAEQSGVSPYHLASRALQEVGYNGSSSVTGTVAGYEGIFNFYNIGATSSSNPVINGLEFAKQYNGDYFLPWNTKWKAIAGGAIYLGKRYINVGQDTLYLQKFNVQGTNPYNHQYMTNVQAPSAEAGRLADAYATSLDRAIVFKIPVYRNMPEANAELPTDTGIQIESSALSFIEVEGYTLTPAFSSDIYEYSVSLPEGVYGVNINAAALSQSATIDGTGFAKLEDGDNLVQITVSTSSGKTSTYKVKLSVPYGNYTIRGEQYAVDADSFVLQKIKSADGTSSTYMYGFEVGESVAAALGKMKPMNCTLRIVNSDRTKNDGIVATGNILQICTNDGSEVLQEILLVVFGDTSGDGIIDGKDMLYMYRHILGIATLDSAYAEAGDVRWDTLNQDAQGAKTSDITGVDMLYVQRHLLGISSISQK